MSHAGGESDSYEAKDIDSMPTILYCKRQKCQKSELKRPIFKLTVLENRFSKLISVKAVSKLFCSK